MDNEVKDMFSQIDKLDFLINNAAISSDCDIIETDCINKTGEYL